MTPLTLLYCREKEYLMREYDSYEEACQDPDLDLRVIWKCDLCGHEREEPPNCNEGGFCVCGGQYLWNGESYNG